jgi:hypothetical protein
MRENLRWKNLKWGFHLTDESNVHVSFSEGHLLQHWYYRMVCTIQNLCLLVTVSRFWFDFFSVLPVVNNHCSRYDCKPVNPMKMEVESIAKALCL